MGMVGGSRHYTGGGLGDMGMWECPSCGAENAGPLTGGCQLCGAGKPDAGPPPPPPRPAPTLAPTPRPVAEAPAEDDDTPNAWTHWIARHPDATLEQAFTAGYIEGVRDARRGMRAPESPPLETFRPEGIVNRTLIAALELFRDQVLIRAREEIESGEWLSVAGVNDLIEQLRTTELQAEEAHV